MPHNMNNSMDALDKVFSAWVVSQELWPLQSPSLNLCDFYVWDTLTEKVYMNNLHFLEELQENFRHKSASIPIQQLSMCLKTHSKAARHA
jgi:hypothetical protein